jgi:hypothetical protein
MDYFTEIPDATAITCSNGVYRQVKMYARGDRVYARHGAGFVRMHQGQTTSAPGVRWIEFDGADAKLIEAQGAVRISNLKVIAAQ